MFAKSEAKKFLFELFKEGFEVSGALLSWFETSAKAHGFFAGLPEGYFVLVVDGEVAFEEGDVGPDEGRFLAFSAVLVVFGSHTFGS